MTLPYERTRSLLWMEEFLRDASSALPEDLAREAKEILVHFPRPEEIHARAELGGWLEPLGQSLPFSGALKLPGEVGEKTEKG